MPLLSRVFTSPLWGDHWPQLAVNVAKKGIIARAEMSDKTSIFSLPSADPAAIDDSAKNLEMSTVAGSRGRSQSFVFGGSMQRQKKCRRRRKAKRNTNPKSLLPARRLGDSELRGRQDFMVP